MNKDENKEAVNEELKNEGADQEQSLDDAVEEVVAEQLDPLEEMKIELAEWKNKYLRLHAEFDNFRKRTMKEKSDLIKNAGSGVIKEILPVIDDFDRAILANENNQDLEAVKEGFELIQTKFFKTLAQKGLEPMEALGKDFDTDHHEAITQLPGDEDKKGKVVDVVEKGFFLNDQVLRFAKVVVGS